MKKLIAAAFLIAVGTCLIVNLAVSGGITWAWYPVVSIPYAAIITLPPLYAKKNGAALSLLAFTAATLPFLFLLSLLTPVRNWYFGLGAPVAAVTIAAAWATYGLFKFIKVNNWYKAAVTVFLFGAVVSGIAQYFVAGFLGESFVLFYSLSGVINLISVLVITGLMFVVGYGKKPAAKRSEKPAAFDELPTVPEMDLRAN